MPRIAVVEDDEIVAESIAYSLRRVGHEIQMFSNGDEAATRLLQDPPDLAVLDLSLPGMDGLDVCRLLRNRYPRLPIIILTARGEEIDRVLGLETGADDYVVKPFSLRELEARVKGLLRRASPVPPTPPKSILTCGHFSLDHKSGDFVMDNKKITLSPREEELMTALMERQGEIISREDLLTRVWGEDFIGEAKTLDVHIRWLRLKIEQDPSNPRHILTVRGRGYRFQGD